MHNQFKKCLACGIQYDMLLRSGRKTQTCSSSCSTIYRNKNKVWTVTSKALISAANTGRLAGSNNPNYRGGGVGFRCSYCLEEFQVPVMNFGPVSGQVNSVLQNVAAISVNQW